MIADALNPRRALVTTEQLGHEPHHFRIRIQRRERFEILISPLAQHQSFGTKLGMIRLAIHFVGPMSRLRRSFFRQTG